MDGTQLNFTAFSGPAYASDDVVNPTAMDVDGNVYVSGLNSIGNHVVVNYDVLGKEISTGNLSELPAAQR